MTVHVIYTPTVLQKMNSKQTSAMFLVSQYEKNKINTMIFIDCDHDAAYRVVMSWEEWRKLPAEERRDRFRNPFQHFL